MDDVVQTWQLDPALRHQMSLHAATRALQQGKPDLAAQILEELLDVSPNDPTVLGWLVSALLSAGQFHLAQQPLEQLAEVGPMPAHRWVQLAMCRYECANPEGALEACAHAHAIWPHHAEAHYLRALSLELLEQPGADEAYLRAFQCNPLAHPLPMKLDEEAVQGLLSVAFDELEDHISTFWQGVPVEVLHRPSLDNLRTSQPPLSPRTACMFMGSPARQSAKQAASLRPSSLRIFITALEKATDPQHAVRLLVESLTIEAETWTDLQQST